MTSKNKEVFKEIDKSILLLQATEEYDEYIKSINRVLTIIDKEEIGKNNGQIKGNVCIMSLLPPILDCLLQIYDVILENPKDSPKSVKQVVNNLIDIIEIEKNKQKDLEQFKDTLNSTENKTLH